MNAIHELIKKECEEIADLLIMKNKAYGNSFAEPINIFSQTTASEQIDVRIDDKLNRIAKGYELGAVPEDTEKDLIGYLILKRVLRKSKEVEQAPVLCMKCGKKLEVVDGAVTGYGVYGFSLGGRFEGEKLLGYLCDICPQPTITVVKEKQIENTETA